MSPIEDFHVRYEAPNPQGTFSEGDTVVGTVSFKLTKDTKVKSVTVKAVGEAEVRWTEGTGDRRETYSAHTHYFKVKQRLVAKSDQGTQLSKGLQKFPFQLQIPNGDMPSSFHGTSGRIFYSLIAKISRSWRLPSTKQKELNFLSRKFPSPSLKSSDSVTKNTGTFSKGEIRLHASLNRQVCSPGDTLTAVAQISNVSSKEIKPKFALEQKTVYDARRLKKNNSYNILFKMVGDPIGPHSETTATCQVHVPTDAIHSLANCDLISVEYYLKVYLDVKMALDPEVRLPLVVIPSTATNPGFSGPFAPGAPSYSDFPPATLPAGPYGFSVPGPSQYSASGPVPYPGPGNSYYTQWPQGPSAYPPPVAPQNQGPVAPPPFQPEDDPPTYPSLFSTS